MFAFCLCFRYAFVLNGDGNSMISPLLSFIAGLAVGSLIMFLINKWLIASVMQDMIDHLNDKHL